ncbi:MAG: glycosyltransferase family 9 protein [Acidobacteriota bacterium]
MKILVRATNWLGDAIMSVPALAALRRAHPHAHITILGPAWLAGLYGAESFCDETIVYPRSLTDKLRLARSLRHRFDLAILLQNAFEAAAFAFLSRIPRRIGFSTDRRGFLLTQSFPPVPLTRHERFYYLELLLAAGLIPAYPPEAPISLQGFDTPRLPRLGISPGAAFGSAKRWYPDRFAAAAIAIAREKNFSVALFGSPEEAPIVAEVERLIHAAAIPVENFAGRTSLRDFIQLVASCSLMLTNDSGAMHVSYAVGTPSLTIFGPTDHIGTGPVGPHARILRQPVDCSPCKLRECPIDHRCMSAISPAQVAQEALILLK